MKVIALAEAQPQQPRHKTVTAAVSCCYYRHRPLVAQDLFASYIALTQTSTVAAVG